MMALEGVYAGDDYLVAKTGLFPYDYHQYFLPWEHVEQDYLLRLPVHKTATSYPEGTQLATDAPLAHRVEEYLGQWGTSVSSIAENVEHHVRTADPWTVNYGIGWFPHEAGHAVNRLARRGYSRQTSAQIIADLSSQNPWFGTPDNPHLGNREEAVRYGTQVSKMLHKTGKYANGYIEISDDDVDRAANLFKSEKTGQSTHIIRPGRYDISHVNPARWEVSPRHLAELPEFHSRATRPTRANGIASALGLRKPEHLAGKTYPFHHNILDPFTSPYVTGDTWMVDIAGLSIPRNQRPSFYQGKGGDRTPIPVYKGYGQLGLATGVTMATARLNESSPAVLRGYQPLHPLHTQSIAWCSYQDKHNPTFHRVANQMRALPWDKVFGFNFGQPSQY